MKSKDKKKIAHKRNLLTDSLIVKAKEMMRFSYAPYSRHYVGAALLGSNGRIYTGVNVENASYGLTLCAEKAALAQAVSDGCRSFKSIAVYEKKKGVILPCGACRQALYEFSPKCKVALRSTKGTSFISLEKLLPKAFSL